MQLLGRYAFRIAFAIGVMFLGRYLADKARLATAQLVRRPDVSDALSDSVESMLVRVAYYGTLTTATICALVILGVPIGAILSISSVALVILVVALRESLENFAAAVIFVIYQPFRVGEEIETMGRKGIVMEMQLFNTVLRQSDRSLAVLSNGDIQKEGLVNYSRFGISRVDLPFTLTYDDDIDKARSIIMDLMTSDPQVLKDPPPVVVPVRMGENGLEMQARPFVMYDDYDPVQFSFRKQITAELNAAGIAPAVSQHDVKVTH